MIYALAVSRYMDTPVRSHRIIAILCALAILAAGGTVGTKASATTTYGLTTVTFGYTGSSQLWSIPTGVQSVYVTMTGGAGGGNGYSQLNFSKQLVGVLNIPLGTTQLEINVGGNGGWSSNGASSTVGGWGDGFSGASGGTSSSSTSWAGGAGGGATDIRVAGAPATQVLMVAGGAGGSGGDADSMSYIGGAGSHGSLNPQSGSAGGGSGGDGGAGGTPWTAPNTPASSGGNSVHDDDGGGGGGGGGWSGGGGGQNGQADGISFYAGAGGGGAGGLSYANPLFVSNVSENSTNSAGVSITYLPATAASNVSVDAGGYRWVPAANTSAIGVNYELFSGELPPGIVLNGEAGTLIGTAQQVGVFAFGIAVNGYITNNIPITTVVTDQWTVTPGGGAWLSANSASAITPTTATLNGFVKGGGIPVTSIICSYATFSDWAANRLLTAPATPSSVPGNLERTMLSCPISGLTANTAYKYQFNANQESTPIVSIEQEFTTGSTPAVLTTEPATSITTTTATGNGTITALQNVSSIVCRIATQLQNVRTATPINATPSSTTGVVNGTPLTCPFTGLSANTLYYYGVFATDASGTSTSPTWSEFVTGEAPPRLGTITVGSVDSSNAQITGSISATNQPITSIYCRVVPSPGNPAMGTAVAATPFTASWDVRNLSTNCNLTGLSPNTAYKARMYAVDPDGTSSSGNTVTFTTSSSGGGAPTTPTTPTSPTTPTTPTTPPATDASSPTASPATQPLAPSPTLVLPGLVEVPSGVGIPIRNVAVREAPATKIANAPLVNARRDLAFSLRVQDLRPNRVFRVQVARGSERPLRWKVFGEVKTNKNGSVRLPALLSTRKGVLTIQLTSAGYVGYIQVEIRP